MGRGAEGAPKPKESETMWRGGRRRGASPAEGTVADQGEDGRESASPGARRLEAGGRGDGSCAADSNPVPAAGDGSRGADSNAAPAGGDARAKRRRRVAFVAALFAVSLLAAALVPILAVRDARRGWRTLEPGLDWGLFPVGRTPAYGDGMLRVLRVDLTKFDLKLVMASAVPEKPRLSVGEWRRRGRYVAAINGGMFQEDRLTSVGLMKARGHVNNPRVSSQRAVLAFDRLRAEAPPAQIIDRDAQPFEELAKDYGTLVQSIRMVALDGRNVWEPQADAASVAAFGFDRAGRALFIFCQSPAPVHDVADALRRLPLDLRNAMYLEGGPTAQFSLEAGDQQLDFSGLYESGSFGEGRRADAVPIPNVIAVQRRVRR